MTEKNRGCTIGSRSGTGFANERPNLEDKYGELKDFFCNVDLMVAHNLSFDKDMLKNDVERAYFLAGKNHEKLRFEQKGERVLLHLGTKPLDPVDNVIVLEMVDRKWP